MGCAASSRNSALPRSKVLADCGRKAYSWFRWKRDKMEKCVRKEAKISAPCTKCFSEAGQYGYNHCKSQCLFGDWCSERCLGCTGKHDAKTEAWVLTWMCRSRISAEDRRPPLRGLGIQSVRVQHSSVSASMWLCTVGRLPIE